MKNVISSSWKSLLAVGVIVILSISPAWASDMTQPQLCIELFPMCDDGAVPGDRITVYGSVENCGEVALESVQISIVEIDKIVGWFDTLDPGQWESFTGYYNPPDCGPVKFDVKASGIYNFEYAPGAVIKYKVNDQKSLQCEVPCDVEKGCTLTPGYWKTHSGYGPASYDPSWAFIGEDTIFFLSGQSYYDVLWTEPSGGNAYYILAHAYIAAELNMLSGTSAPESISTAWNEATDLFMVNTPEDIGALGGSDTLRKEFTRIAEMLDDYNNGYTGPGHCND